MCDCCSLLINQDGVQFSKSEAVKELDANEIDAILDEILGDEDDDTIDNVDDDDHEDMDEDDDVMDDDEDDVEFDEDEDDEAEELSTEDSEPGYTAESYDVVLFDASASDDLETGRVARSTYYG